MTGQSVVTLTIGERQRRTGPLWRQYPRLQPQPVLYRWSGIPSLPALLAAMGVA